MRRRRPRSRENSRRSHEPHTHCNKTELGWWISTTSCYKQYEFPIESLAIKGINICRNNIYCNITSEVIPNGYKIDGLLTFFLMDSCDRCLEHFEEKYNPKFELWLTSDIDLIKENNFDTIHFPESITKIDLVDIFHEFILLEKSIKYQLRNRCGNLLRKNAENRLSGGQGGPGKFGSPWARSAGKR